MSDSLTVTRLKTQTVIRLGGSSADVELIDNDLQECINAATMAYSRIRPREYATVITGSVQGSNTLRVRRPGLINIIRLSAVNARVNIPGPPDPFLRLWRPNLAFADFTLALANAQEIYYTQAQRTLNSDLWWRGQWEASPDNPQEQDYVLYYRVEDPSVTTIGCVYTFTYAPDDNRENGLCWIPRTDHDWFFDYTEARAKTILGRILRKFGGIPDTSGGVQPNDGEALVQEGRADLERLEGQLKRRRGPAVPLLF